MWKAWFNKQVGGLVEGVWVMWKARFNKQIGGLVEGMWVMWKTWFIKKKMMYILSLLQRTEPLNLLGHTPRKKNMVE